MFKDKENYLAFLEFQLDELLKEKSVLLKTIGGTKTLIRQLKKQNLPICSICGNNRQVWTNQITGKLTCHRYGCNNKEVII